THASQGGCNTSNGAVVCNLESLPPGGSATVTVFVTAPLLPTCVTSSASVTGSQSDPDPANNSSSLTTQVSLLPVLLPGGAGPGGPPGPPWVPGAVALVVAGSAAVGLVATGAASTALLGVGRWRRAWRFGGDASFASAPPPTDFELARAAGDALPQQRPAGA